MHDDLTAITEFAEETAIQAGELIIQERRQGSMEHSYKDATELVTQADIKADEFIAERIRETFPGHRILSEEAMPDLTQAENLDTPLWIVDPIDGTVNYAYGHAQVAVSIAYAEKGRVRTGVVHCPFQQETFMATHGQGALLNRMPIEVSGATNLRQSLIATGFPYGKDEIPTLIRRLERVLIQCRDIRRIGSAAVDICWVACGRLDGYYESVSPWDFAAARLIALEAGATCGHFSEVPEGYPEDLWGRDIIITSPGIHPALAELLPEPVNG
ncbi:inositol monophosphatase family protein [Vreelandella utahensis]|uniref:inositol monophosphatase family protein n=1 Tax=Vreelandella halophila TaxID=86177 RepID=UPI0009856DAB|nr:inositol monophosphatase family protein [Halomonas utahensis]